MAAPNGGAAQVDPGDRRLLYVNATEMAWTGSLTASERSATGRGSYLAHCAECHGDDLAGAPPQISVADGPEGAPFSPERVKTRLFGRGWGECRASPISRMKRRLGLPNTC